ncbi:cupin domain-containing protein [Sphingopyxis sp. KK2]|uniref:cupin domain-containing protein n=1 Tax=Sphingopyxis sp. KK2 TaxID=1855727 RepID=UPI00097E5864|nr:cupin domain-containing protein [Sphingopyxis sp. KK2]
MDDISRRNLLAAAAVGSMAGPVAMAAPATASKARPSRFMVERATEGFNKFKAVHEGLGELGVRLFDFDGAAAPANFMIYDIPPGASEGVHLHNLSDPALGPYEEYYYIVEGSGVMTIDKERFPVTAGDHVFAPLDSWRGIANDHPADNLKIFLTYIDRSV